MSQVVFRPTEALSVHHSGGKDLARTNTRGSGRLRTGQPTVLARLQALLPSNSPSPKTSAADVPVSPEVRQTAETSGRPPPRKLKVHVVSWNMHDSLPKGNLEDLLGAVPPYTPCPDNQIDGLHIPNLSEEDGHPYHFIVVAGQECPTVSGIPMGLGASFRHKEKDKNKDGEKSAKKAKGKEGKDKDKDELPDLEGPSTSSIPITSTGDIHSHGPSSGWSWILEEWYCHGLGQRDGKAGTSSAAELYDSQATSPHAQDGSDKASEVQQYAHARGDQDSSCVAGKDKKKKGREKKYRVCCKDETRIGPYELLVKERLMGIYMAVFIYRDLKPLVRGVSKSAVSTGLIGGRVGNKGGVGISVNLDGTTLLFINAHLAAHEERVMNRVANFAKIKSELHVDDFLPPDDPRVMSEDLTDKFDYTFLFGDLNFRLDVTRLHADWLISRKDYSQALTFDQLQTLMKKGDAFVGFHEATIDFPPTFKYDVMKTIKRDKSVATRDSGRDRVTKRRRGYSSNLNLSEVQETEAERSSRMDDDQERGVSLDADDDNGSFVSTAPTAMSMQSRTTGYGDSDDADAFVPPRSPRSSTKSKEGSPSNASQKLLRATAALKAKTKWLSLIKSNSSPDSRSSTPRRPSQKSHRGNFSASSPQIKFIPTVSDTTSSAFRSASSATELGRPSAPSITELRRSSSRKSAKSAKSSKVFASMKGTENTQQEAGVYDSSSKQRVPSWCDRILWKTTVQPDPDSDDEYEVILPEHRANGLGPRMLAFLSQALRPLSTRNRAVSFSSFPSLPTTDTPPLLPAKGPLRPGAYKSDSQPLINHAPEIFEKDSALMKVKSLANAVNTRYRPHRKARSPKLLKSRSIEPASTTPLMLSSNIGEKHDRTYTAMPVISAPTMTLPEDATLVAEVETDEAPPVPPKDFVARQRTPSSRGWLRFPFFNRETEPVQAASDINIDPIHPRESTSQAPRRHRRGEVVPLSYNSLDDQAMWRLEGRSDHRPVIGSYVIYM